MTWLYNLCSQAVSCQSEMKVVMMETLNTAVVPHYYNMYASDMALPVHFGYMASPFFPHEEAWKWDYCGCFYSRVLTRSEVTGY